MANITEFIIWRDSVCAGDDVDAPHELVLLTSTSTLRSITDRLLEMHYLAHIAGGRATWILFSDGSAGRPLAVLAQQWSQPRFLVEPDTDIHTFVRLDAKPHLYLSYWNQVDPDRVFECLQRGEPLPDRYSR